MIEPKNREEMSNRRGPPLYASTAPAPSVTFPRKSWACSPPLAITLCYRREQARGALQSLALPSAKLVASTQYSRNWPASSSPRRPLHAPP